MGYYYYYGDDGKTPSIWGVFELRGNKIGKCIGKNKSLVSARAMAYKLVVESKFRKAYRIYDTLDNGYNFESIYFHGAYNRIVSEYCNLDYEGGGIVALRSNGKLAESLRYF